MYDAVVHKSPAPVTCNLRQPSNQSCRPGVPRLFWHHGPVLWKMGGGYGELHLPMGKGELCLQPRGLRTPVVDNGKAAWTKTLVLQVYLCRVARNVFTANIQCLYQKI